MSAFSNAVNDAFAHLGLTHTAMPHDHWRVWKTAQSLGLSAGPLAHCNRIDAFFTILLAVVNFFDRERIRESLGTLPESDAVLPPILGRLVVIPFELIVMHKLRDTSTRFKKLTEEDCAHVVATIKKSGAAIVQFA